MIKQPSDCKDYLKAKSAEGLKILMIRNNLQKNAYHNYEIIHDGSFWYAWFEFDAEKLIQQEAEKVANIK